MVNEVFMMVEQGGGGVSGKLSHTKAKVKFSTF